MVPSNNDSDKITIPRFVVESFLHGRTPGSRVKQFTQDSGVVTDVWLAFARNIEAPQRVLISPSRDFTPAELGYALHKSILAFRKEKRSEQDQDFRLIGGKKQAAERPGVSPLEGFVVAKIYFDELVHIILPMTAWWHRKDLDALRRTAVQSTEKADERLENAILAKMGSPNSNSPGVVTGAGAPNEQRVLEAAFIAALIGMYFAVRKDPKILEPMKEVTSRESRSAESEVMKQVTGPESREDFVKWAKDNSSLIARQARMQLSHAYGNWFEEVRKDFANRSPSRSTSEFGPPEMIDRVFEEREASIAGDVEGLCAIKADAARRVFDVSCKDIGWAVIDSGIASRHPAFIDHDPRDALGRSMNLTRSRIKAAYDFTHINEIVSYDLTLRPAGSRGRTADIERVVELLKPDAMDKDQEGWRGTAVENLKVIALQLDKRTTPDWGLIEPLIRIDENGNAPPLVSDHGTHVAGILGADWRVLSDPVPSDPAPGAPAPSDPAPSSPVPRETEVRLRGVCPDIQLYDLRVVMPESVQATESALLAAIEFVKYLNGRGGLHGPAIHGVNISMSIPHDVRNHGCGSTPVCAASDRLVASGVVVVAAAGNRGWNEQELGFGNFVFSSITDPGNAHDVITVGSTHRLRPHLYGVSYFSSRGPTGDGRVKPDLVAPGEKIRGPVPGGGEEDMDGTSMAAPFVSGAAAMLLARHRELIGQPVRVKRILCDSATDLGRERYFQGHGLVDILRALQSV